MTSPCALFVKLSSLGDVIHLFPAVTDLHAMRPDVRIEWAVEEAYESLVRLHPAVERVIPVALRRLRTRVLSGTAWGALAATRRELASRRYEWIIDAQGLLKSVAIARLAQGAVFGYDRASIREPAAARFCDVGLAVSRKLHAVERNRLLVGGVFGYRPPGPPSYGIRAPQGVPAWLPEGGYVVALHASSRAEKGWPQDRWKALAHRIGSEGLAVVYPGGSDAERSAAARLASDCARAIAAPAMTLPEAAALLSHASAVVGVDTGLTHLAVALGAPTVGLYVATRPGLTGLSGDDRAVNLGSPEHVPTVEEVSRILFGEAAGA